MDRPCFRRVRACGLRLQNAHLLDIHLTFSPDTHPSLSSSHRIRRRLSVDLVASPKLRNSIRKIGHGKRDDKTRCLRFTANISIRVKTSLASGGLAVLPAAATTRIRRATRRISPSTSRHHNPPPASAARRSERLAPTPQRSSPPSTRPHDVSSDTCGCRECMTTYC